jgi:hypothetical protein
MFKENMKYEQLNTLFTLAFGSDKLIKYRDNFLKNNLADINFNIKLHSSGVEKLSFLKL